CPRERRLTNHAVVAMIEEDVKQTRCTTCDAEHPYKGGKVPRRRKKETTAALYKEVLASHLANDGARHGAEDPEADPSPAPTTTPVPPSAPMVHAAAPAADEEETDRDELNEADRPLTSVETRPEEGDSPGVDGPVELEEGPVHRPLIRAQLPRIEGQKEERRLPEFTIRQRGNGFRGDSRMKPNRHGGNGHAGNGGANGNRAHGGSRFAGQRPPGAGGRGQSGRGGGQPGFRSGQRQGGGRKRSR